MTLACVQTIIWRDEENVVEAHSLQAGASAGDANCLAMHEVSVLIGKS